MSETTRATAEATSVAGDKSGNLNIAYEQLCKSHDSIDSFRTTLLHLLPVASAGGIFLLLNKDIFDETVYVFQSENCNEPSPLKEHSMIVPAEFGRDGVHWNQEKP